VQTVPVVVTRGHYLERVDGRLELRSGDSAAGVSLNIADVQRRSRQGRGLALAKACGIRPGLRVLDGMAGFGLDGSTLAALGCSVLMVERDPLLYTLLEDAVVRLLASGVVSGEIELRHGDVREVLAEGRTFDTVYLDPMFPERAKAALPRRSAQLLEDLIGAADADLVGIVEDALVCAEQRVVVKRRRHDPAARQRPDWQIVGRSVRFDVYRGAAPAGG